MFDNLRMTIRSMRGTGANATISTHPRSANGALQATRARCTQCRGCISRCPTRALTVSTKAEFQLHFHPGRCAACLRCVDACPVGDLHFVPLAETFLLPGQADEREVLK